MSFVLNYYSGFTIIFGLLVFFLFIQMIHQRYFVKSMFISLLFGIAASFLSVILSLFPSLTPLQNIFNGIQLGLYGIQFTFWYLHLEKMIRIQPQPFRFGIVIFFLSVDLVSVFFIVILNNYSAIFNTLWFFADVGYYGLGIFIFLGVGSWMELKAYHYSHNWQLILFIIAYHCIGFGLILDGFDDLSAIFNFTILYSYLPSIDNVGYLLILCGLIIVLLSYIYNLNFAFQSNFDVFSLIITSKVNFKILFTLWIKSKKVLNTESELTAGILQAMTSLFGEIFKSRKIIQTISGRNANLLIEPGQYIIGMLLTENVSEYVVQSLRSFVRSFETKFKSQLEEYQIDEIPHTEIVKIWEPLFPNCTIDSMKPNTSTEKN